MIKNIIIGLLLILCFALWLSNKRLHMVANGALTSACRGQERDPYPVVCGPRP